MTTTTTPRRNAALAIDIVFDRLGAPTSIPRARVGAPPTTPTLSLIIPPHTTRNASAVVGFIAEHVHRFVHMYIDAPRYAVTVDYAGAGTGVGQINGGELGSFTIAPQHAA